jgi:Cu/Zn superoxide dismutase
MHGPALLTMHDALSSLRGGARVVLALALAGGLAACKTTDDAGSRPSAAVPGIGAWLVPVGGSVVRGLVTFRPYEGGVTILVNFGGAPAGQQRVVIHTNANCTSANGFSAGPPMLLPGTSAPIVVGVRTEGSEGTVSTVTRIAGLAIDGPNGLEGKSVVVHSGGSGPLDASPGVPNGRLACGLIGPVTSLF